MILDTEKKLVVSLTSNQYWRRWVLYFGIFAARRMNISNLSIVSGDREQKRNTRPNHILITGTGRCDGETGSERRKERGDSQWQPKHHTQKKTAQSMQMR